MENERYMKVHEYRIACAGNHAGPRHIFEKANLSVALSAARVWNRAKSNDTRRNCLPMAVQSRTVTSWTTTWNGYVSVSDAVNEEFDRALEDAAADPEL